MKTFLKWFAIPLLVGTIATTLYIIDTFLGDLFVAGGSFMWVAFALWTVFYNAKLKARVKGFVGVIIGFCAAKLAMQITGLSTFSIAGICVMGVIGVFVVNYAVMNLKNAGVFFAGSISGVFVGMGLTFSGLGVGLVPVGTDALIMLAIIITYAFLGLACGLTEIYFTQKIKKKLEQLKSEKTE